MDLNSVRRESVTALLASALVLGTVLKGLYGTYAAFWIPLLLLSFQVFLSLSKKDDREFNKDLVLTLYVLSIAVSSTLLLPEEYQVNKDGYFEAQYASTIIDRGYVDISWGLGFAKDYYGHNPAIHLVIAETSLVTGLDPMIAAKYMFLILARVLVALMALLILKATSRRIGIDERYAYISIALYAVSYGLLGIAVSRRSIAIVFLLMQLCILVSSLQVLPKTVLFLAFSFLRILSDHSVGYLMVFLCLIVLAVYVVWRPREGSCKREIAFIAGYMVFDLLLITLLRIDSPYLYMNELVYVRQVVESFSQNPLGTLLGLNAEGARWLPTAPLWKSVVTHLTLIIFYLAALKGLTLFYRQHARGRKRDIYSVAIISVTIYSFLGFPVLLYVMKTGASVFSQPFIWLPFLVLCFYFTHSFTPLLESRRYPALAVLTLLIMGNFLLSFPVSLLYPENESTVTLEDYRAKNDLLYYSGMWLKERSGPEGLIVDGDPTVYDVYAPFYGIEVTGEWWADRLYTAGNEEFPDILIENRTIYTKKRGNYPVRSRYIVTNNMVYRYPSAYMSEMQQFGDMNRFDSSRMLDTVYDNKQVQIRRIRY